MAEPSAAATAQLAFSFDAPASDLALRHPRANREALLHGQLVAYEFRRARRRTIGFSVAPEGLVVSAPRWVPQVDVDAALRERARWVLDKLAQQRERAHRRAAQRIEWREGAVLPFLGTPLRLTLDARVTGTQLDAQHVPPALRVGLPAPAQPEQIRDAVQSWLQRQARRVFEERCAHFAPRLGVQVRRLSLSSAATRWGSASADGAIRLHWRLIHFALPTIDYVVAHELAHLRVMDHSPRFWEVVRSVIPDVERLRDGLRDELLPPLD
jgi:predicted metal-dependent hydrolase